MSRKAIFVGATGQHVGKTTLCLGILSGLCERLGAERVGFTKPVGQRHIEVSDGLHVDKDAVLFKNHFDLDCRYEDMSPVLVPSGFTRRFLDGEVNLDHLKQRITSAFEMMTREHDYTIVEGTGHIGVGSIIDLNNAQVAALLGLDMVIIASGGLGSSFDELALNLHLCERHGAKVKGVILNRVFEDKRGMIMKYFAKALKRWDVPLLGCVPYNQFLSTPCMRDFETLFKTKLLCGESHLYRHFPHTRLVATTFDAYRELICPQQLVITPARREDIILATLEAHRSPQSWGVRDLEGGMILTGRHPPSKAILDQIQRANIPILYAKLSSYETMGMITSFIAKTRRGDVEKIERAKALVEESVDWEALL